MLCGQILIEINKARATGRSCGGQVFAAAPPLKRDSRLDAAAQAHSVDMAMKDYFSHNSQDGRTPFTRIAAAGYDHPNVGENIAAGSAAAAETVAQWLKSPGHCANIMNPVFVDTGIGYGYGQRSSYVHYWTQTFGAPR